MGLLMDIRSGKNDAFGLGVYALIFWLIAGGGFGVMIASFSTANVEKAFSIFGFVGALLGLAVGFYAAWGTSTLAKILRIPGALIALLHVGRTG